jgi:NAD(P)-dependent dehydrogenase (short-subunit alcohol dehydrogenase family)
VELKGKVAVVTGAGAGIGKAVAIKFAKEGAFVALLGNVNEEIIEVESLLLELGYEAVSIATDVSNEEQVLNAVQTITEKAGRIDILANCAGVQRYGTVVDTSSETWDEVMNVNVKGIFLLSKYTIPEMEKQGAGAIVNISSVQAFASQKTVAAYTASKGAINALTRAMALDHADKNIRVNTVCPASVDTPMLRWAADLFGDNQDKTVATWGKMHPLGRVGKPEEVAEMVCFLVSSRSGFVTGGEFKIDGGLTAALGVALPEEG